MRKRNLTREERALRNAKVAYLLFVALWAVILIAVAVGLAPSVSCVEAEAEPEATVVIDEPPTPTEEAQATIEIPEPVVVIEPPVVVEPDPVPIREDIPLDAETQRLLYQACEETGIRYELALSVIWRESRFQNIVGDNGNSIGYMQIQPRWHGDRMERLGVTDLADPHGNFLVGCDYLAEMLGKDRGVEWALHAYNGGASYANEMAKAGKVSKYAESVLDYMNNLGGN
jgi:hypothetical protein